MHIIIKWHKSYLSKKRLTHNLNITAENVYDDEHMPFSEKLCQKETSIQTRSSKKENDILYRPDK